MMKHCTSPLEVCEACVGILHLFLQISNLLLQLSLHFTLGAFQLREFLLRNFASCWQDTLQYTDTAYENAIKHEQPSYLFRIVDKMLILSTAFFSSLLSSSTPLLSSAFLASESAAALCTGRESQNIRHRTLHHTTPSRPN